MTFSYSRLIAFDSCRYKWLLKYIYGIEKKEDSFYSSYGTFIHGLLAKFYRGEADSERLALEYLENYFQSVTGRPQRASTAVNYFNQGLAMFNRLKMPLGEVLGVEQEVRWQLGGRDYIGYIDLMTRDGDDITLCDHKSRDLKPRSRRAKPTKADRELDEYLRQLYLYCIPVYEQYGKYPVSLNFNCYRTGVLIKEEFHQEAFEATCQWAIDKANEIEMNEDWRPTMDYFGCKYLCDVKHECEYYNAGR